MTDAARPLAGRTALVTGAAIRTGRTIALELAEAGANLLLHYHKSHDKAVQTAQTCTEMGVRVEIVSADLCQPQAAAEAIVQQAQRANMTIDILINNVGNYPVTEPLELEVNEFNNTLSSNLLAPYALIRELLPMLTAPASADIINLGYSGADYVLANRHAMAYQISKTGLLILTRTLAQELGPRGIRVNMVSPGQLENSIDLPGRISDHIPLGHAGTEDDIAATILFMLTSGRYINGANIDVGGGYRIALSRRLDDD